MGLIHAALGVAAGVAALCYAALAVTSDTRAESLVFGGLAGAFALCALGSITL